MFFPGQPECANFEYMLWFESLLFYGCDDSRLQKGDVDINLLPAMVEKVILNKLAGKETNTYRRYFVGGLYGRSFRKHGKQYETKNNLQKYTLYLLTLFTLTFMTSLMNPPHCYFDFTSLSPSHLVCYVWKWVNIFDLDLQ